MTSTFDAIASMERWIADGKLTDEEVEEALSILDDAVKEASSRKPKTWNYEDWFKRRYKDKTEEQIDKFFGNRGAAKFNFISDTHSALDHTDKWHLKVFSRKFLNMFYDFYEPRHRKLRGW